jgi:ArsR family transcriptional regulator, arsenate/arsenite/antimonite-responsive transcriptional repressor
VRDNHIVLMMKALSDPTRLRIFEFLRNCSCDVCLDDSGYVRQVVGATVGEVCCRVLGTEKMTSSISFHLKELRLSGLIETEKRGKSVFCRVNRVALAELATYFHYDVKHSVKEVQP